MTGTGTITFGGIGSGMDTESIVTGLIQADSGTLNTMKSKQSDTDSAVSSLSNLSTLLSTLQSSVGALADARSVGSYTATSSGSAVAASTNGNALPGAYDISVLQLAREQRNYSSTFSAENSALGQSGSLSIQIGSGKATSIDIASTDTLDDVAAKINSAGLRVSASVFNDGTNFRLQLRGLDTGAANAITFGENGVDLGLSASASKVQSAQDSQIKVDGFTVTRPTNQVVGAIQGVTLALTQTTTSPITLSVATDANGLSSKVQSVVNAYNAVVKNIQTTAGYGSTAGTNAILQGDATLRSISSQLSNAALTQVTGAGTFSNLNDLGISLNKDGTLGLDTSKLTSALNQDAASVAAVLAGPAGGKGIMDIVSDLANNITGTDGILSLRSSTLSSNSKSLTDQITSEQDRLNKEADNLRAQFTQMDTTVAGDKSQLQYLQTLFK